MQDQAFTDDFRTQFDLLMRLRRDVRRFRTDPVDEAVIIALNLLQHIQDAGLAGALLWRRHMQARCVLPMLEAMLRRLRLW